MKLEKHIEIIFPEYKAKCHANRRNSCIHRGLDEAIFAYSNFKDTIYEIELFLNEHFCNFCSVLEENQNVIKYLWLAGFTYYMFE